MVDIYHRSQIGSGLVSSTNPHGTGLNDLSVGNITFYQQLLNHGLRSGHAIELVIETNNLDLTRTLIEAGAVNFTQLKGLDTAIRLKNVEMVELLIEERGSNQFQKDLEAHDALLSLAITSGDIRIFTLVEGAGYWDPGLWNAFVDANEVSMLQSYLQDELHALQIKKELTFMKKRAIEKGQLEILTYLMYL